ncbi:GerMN domain-containing protein [Nonomuraea sp. FMUSA5-5]|uniref:GerMN domain-containing protein n=1 Tax=Nonomuraea composti TaxID=2720023 RepID=A0ABX1AS40_9ACTN|nr:GerMN domain-containing protein [Nonomuraea sp. FMUSA5-5]
MLVAMAPAACGIADTGASPAGEPVRGGLTADGGTLLKVYFVTPEGTWPVSRPAQAGDRLRQAMDALLAGPTADERARGLATELPAAREPLQAAMSGGTSEGTSGKRVRLRLPWLVRDLRHMAVSQLVCTAAAAAGGDPIVEVYEPGMKGNSWPVRCDATGAAVPVEQGGFG